MTASRALAGLLLPLAFALGGQSADYWTTATAPSVCHEANPLVGNVNGRPDLSRAVAVKAITVGATVGLAAIAVKRKHPKFAEGLLWFSAAMGTSLAVHNVWMCRS